MLCREGYGECAAIQHKFCRSSADRTSVRPSLSLSISFSSYACVMDGAIVHAVVRTRILPYACTESMVDPLLLTCYRGVLPLRKSRDATSSIHNPFPLPSPPLPSPPLPSPPLPSALCGSRGFFEVLTLRFLRFTVSFYARLHKTS
jgi:hypothetical protein